MHIAVVANGDLPDQGKPDAARVLAQADSVIAADGGLVHCASLGVWPSRLVGDLDSAPAPLVEQARAAGTTVAEHPTDKEATDLELALDEAIDAGADQITVVAPFGGRLDHELATIGLLASERWLPAAISATDGRRSLWVVRSQLELSLRVGATLSLVPWHGDVTGVSTQGLQWPLRAEPLPLGSTRGVSNVARADVQMVTVETGTLLALTDSV